MATFRSNLNSVSNTSGLTNFKQRLATCLKNWRRRTFIHYQEQYNRKHEHLLWQNFRKENPRFYIYLKENIFKYNTTEQIQQLKEKICKLFWSKKKSPSSSYTNETKPEKVEIIAKLVATSLLTATTTKTSSTSKETNLEEKSYHSIEEQVYNNIRMTILDSSIYTIRSEYPEIDSEIRGILLARCQEGATIAEIRGNFRIHCRLQILYMTS